MIPVQVQRIKQDLQKLRDSVKKDDNLSGICSFYIETDSSNISDYLTPFLCALKSGYNQKPFLFVYEACHYIVQMSVHSEGVVPTDKKTSVLEKETSVCDKETSAPEEQTSAPENETSACEKETSTCEKETSVCEKETSVPEKETSVCELPEKQILCENDIPFIHMKPSEGCSNQPLHPKEEQNFLILSMNIHEELIETLLSLLPSTEEARIKILQILSQLIPQTSSDLLFKIFYNIVHLLDLFDRKLFNVLVGVVLQLVGCCFVRYLKSCDRVCEEAVKKELTSEDEAVCVMERGLGSHLTVRVDTPLLSHSEKPSEPRVYNEKLSDPNLPDPSSSKRNLYDPSSPDSKPLVASDGTETYPYISPIHNTHPSNPSHSQAFSDALRMLSDLKSLLKTHNPLFLRVTLQLLKAPIACKALYSNSKACDLLIEVFKDLESAEVMNCGRFNELVFECLRVYFHGTKNCMEFRRSLDGSGCNSTERSVFESVSKSHERASGTLNPNTSDGKAVKKNAVQEDKHAVKKDNNGLAVKEEMHPVKNDHAGISNDLSSDHLQNHVSDSQSVRRIQDAVIRLITSRNLLNSDQFIAMLDVRSFKYLENTNIFESLPVIQVSSKPYKHLLKTMFNHLVSSRSVRVSTLRLYFRLFTQYVYMLDPIGDYSSDDGFSPRGVKNTGPVDADLGPVNDSVVPVNNNVGPINRLPIIEESIEDRESPRGVKNSGPANDNVDPINRLPISELAIDGEVSRIESDFILTNVKNLLPIAILLKEKDFVQSLIHSDCLSEVATVIMNNSHIVTCEFALLFDRMFETSFSQVYEPLIEVCESSVVRNGVRYEVEVVGDCLTQKATVIDATPVNGRMPVNTNDRGFTSAGNYQGFGPVRGGTETSPKKYGQGFSPMEDDQGFSPMKTQSLQSKNWGKNISIKGNNQLQSDSPHAQSSVFNKPNNQHSIQKEGRKWPFFFKQSKKHSEQSPILSTAKSGQNSITNEIIQAFTQLQKKDQEKVILSTNNKPLLKKLLDENTQTICSLGRGLSHILTVFYNDSVFPTVVRCALENYWTEGLLFVYGRVYDMSLVELMRWFIETRSFSETGSFSETRGFFERFLVSFHTKYLIERDSNGQTDERQYNGQIRYNEHCMGGGNFMECTNSDKHCIGGVYPMERSRTVELEVESNSHEGRQVSTFTERHRFYHRITDCIPEVVKKLDKTTKSYYQSFLDKLQTTREERIHLLTSILQALQHNNIPIEIVYGIIKKEICSVDCMEVNMKMLTVIAENYLQEASCKERLVFLGFMREVGVVRGCLNDCLRVLGIMNDCLTAYAVDGVGLTEENLSGRGSTRRNLSGESLTDRNLSGMGLTERNLSGESLTDQNMSGNNITQSIQTVIDLTSEVPNDYCHSGNQYVCKVSEDGCLDGKSVLRLEYILTILRIIHNERMLQFNDVYETGIKIIIKFQEILKDRMIDYVLLEHVLPCFLIRGSLFGESRTVTNCGQVSCDRDDKQIEVDYVGSQTEVDRVGSQSRQDGLSDFSSIEGIRASFDELVERICTDLGREERYLQRLSEYGSKLRDFTPERIKEDSRGSKQEVDNLGSLNGRSENLINSGGASAMNYPATYNQFDASVTDLHCESIPIDFAKPNSECLSAINYSATYNQFDASVTDFALFCRQVDLYMYKQLQKHIGHPFTHFNTQTTRTIYYKQIMTNLMNIISYQNKNEVGTTFQFILRELIACSETTFRDSKFTVLYFLQTAIALSHTNDKVWEDITEMLAMNITRFEQCYMYKECVSKIVESIQRFDSNRVKMYEHILDCYSGCRRDAVFYGNLGKFLQTGCSVLVDKVLQIMEFDDGDECLKAYGSFMGECNDGVTEQKVLGRIYKIFRENKVLIEGGGFDGERLGRYGYKKNMSNDTHSRKLDVFNENCNGQKLAQKNRVYDDIFNGNFNGRKLNQELHTISTSSFKCGTDLSVESIQSEGVGSVPRTSKEGDNGRGDNGSTLVDQDAPAKSPAHSRGNNRSSRKGFVGSQSVTVAENTGKGIGELRNTVGTDQMSSTVFKGPETSQNGFTNWNFEGEKACESAEDLVESMKDNHAAVKEASEHFENAKTLPLPTQESPKCNHTAAKGASEHFESEKPLSVPTQVLQKYTQYLNNDNISKSIHINGLKPFQYQTNQTTNLQTILNIINKITTLVQDPILTEKCLAVLKVILPYSREFYEILLSIVEKLHTIYEKELSNNENDNICTYFGTLNQGSESLEMDSCSSESSCRNGERVKERLLKGFIEYFVQFFIEYVEQRKRLGKGKMSIDAGNQRKWYSESHESACMYLSNQHGQNADRQSANLANVRDCFAKDHESTSGYFSRTFGQNADSKSANLANKLRYHPKNDESTSGQFSNSQFQGFSNSVGHEPAGLSHPQTHDRCNIKKTGHIERFNEPGTLGLDYLTNEVFEILTKLSIIQISKKRENLALKSIILMFQMKYLAKNQLTSRMKRVLHSYCEEESVYRDLYPRIKRLEIYLVLDCLIKHPDILKELVLDVVECLRAKDYEVIDRVRVCLLKVLE